LAACAGPTASTASAHAASTPARSLLMRGNLSSAGLVRLCG
jgi:hypothetical protein